MNPDAAIHRLSRDGVPDMPLDAFQCPTQEHAVALAASRAVADKNLCWLALVGKPGTGKTHLACGIIREAMLKYQSVDFMYYKYSRMIRRIRSTYHAAATETELKVVTRFSRAGLLVLDEVGLLRDMSDWERATVDEILDARYEHRRPLVITSNLSARELFDLLGARVASRWSEIGRVVNCTWTDYRKTAAISRR